MKGGAPPPKRQKVTFPPPHVCAGCWWERKFHEAVKANLALRADYLKVKAAGKPKPNPEGRLPRPPRAERDEEDHEVEDLVEIFSRNARDG